jgi:hypothetical protein
MHRRKTRLELAALLLLTAVSSTIPAHANGFATNTKSLPDASKIHPSPLQVDIVDTNPIVRDTRKPVDNTTYVINVGPPPVGQNRVVQIGNGGTPTDGNNSAPGTIPILQNHLPFAGPRSNIPAISPVSSGSLPSGQVGHSLSTQGLIKPRFAQTGSKATPAAGSKLQTGGRVPVETYAPSGTMGGSTISGEKRTTTGIKGTLLTR